MPHLTHKVVVLAGSVAKPSDAHAQALAEFVGADVECIKVTGPQSFISLQKMIPPCGALIAHIDTLAELAESLGDEAKEVFDLPLPASHIFAYGCNSAERCAPVLRLLSGGALTGFAALPAPEGSFQISNEYRQYCGPFSGLHVPGANSARDAVFLEGASLDNTDVLIRVANRPFFVRTVAGGADVYLVACEELANVEQAIDSDLGLVPWFSRLAPMLIFLRKALGKRLWHNDNPRACFIIDDPLLKPSYGFLNYRRLLEAMGQQKFSASIAFIPWNYRRSRQEITSLFVSASASLSLCVHGCDHTGGEFASTNYQSLSSKGRLALDRMRIHQQRHRLGFDDVMVFPQGLFSVAALQALGDCGFLSAVNTSPRATDMQGPLTLRDLLDVAVTRFGNIPLFVRHYPKELAEFAFDLFLGKPALLVEHHGYFRNGYEELSSFVSRLNQLDERLEWRNLANICSQASLQKVRPDGDICMRFYTNRFRFTNCSGATATYYLERHWRPNGEHPIVELNNRRLPVELKDDTLSATVMLHPGKTAELAIAPPQLTKPLADSRESVRGYSTRVFLRRMLSEIRDDHVETNKFLSKLLSNARGALSGKSAPSPESRTEQAV